VEWKDTERGFCRGEFRDCYGVACSIQESSLATEECIWLGADEICYPPGGDPFNSRMHLTREMKGELAHLLLKFSHTGEI
jgi:hypothetical protein